MQDQRVLYSRNTFSVGITIALASWAMVFITLLWGYVVFRVRSGSWMEEYLTRDVLALAVVNTIVLFLSSLCLRQKKIIQSIILGFVFLLGQWSMWHITFSNGLHWQGQRAGSFFYLLSGFHAIHIMAGLVALIVYQVRQHKLLSTTALGIRYFWDFLMVIWLLMFLLIFIVR